METTLEELADRLNTKIREAALAGLRVDVSLKKSALYSSFGFDEVKISVFKQLSQEALTKEINNDEIPF